MEKFLKPLTISLSFLSVLLLPFSLYSALIIAIVPLLVASFGIKDELFTNKTFQVSLITLISSAIVGLFYLINSIIECFINTFGSTFNSEFYSVMLSIQTFIYALVLLFAFVFFIIAIIMLAQGKDVPVMKPIVDKITQNKNIKTKTNKKSKRENDSSLDNKESGEITEEKSTENEDK